MTTELNTTEAAPNLFEGDHWTLPTDIRLVNLAEEEFDKRLKAAGWTDYDFIKSSFREALINAIAHGNLEVKRPVNDDRTWYDLALQKQDKSPVDKKVKVDISVTPNLISVTIKDEGAGFDWDNLPDPTSPEELLKSHGRGVFWMRNFFDDIIYEKEEGGLKVTMIKRKSQI